MTKSKPETPAAESVYRRAESLQPIQPDENFRQYRNSGEGWPMAAFTFNPQTTEYQLQHAYWLGKAASLAYQDEAVIRAETAQWGFDRCQRFCSKHQPPFLIDDTQAYTIANDQMIITAFRGTTPTMICDWLTDANAPAVLGSGRKGLVHLGFNLALASVYPEIREKIKEFPDSTGFRGS
jgi:triacylglycerol lipase